ncbi:alpha/beta hydrolase [Muricauda sp. SCSIO 64092]|uniref:alpha/beta hydrolase n=1 Tax=Allomuricauda sp. SCSIO 64092 TaxID=2908842 RepID=UPI001FF58670|nr:alpha/beta hydrolase [Muricauda sp. SCSIO 64092]UOY06780.1 alpha/beta hydrolase [Muricauda sp. SCSIO 64092]
MEKTVFTIITILVFSFCVSGQIKLVDVQQKLFRTTTQQVIKGEVGYLQVLEKRQNPNSRKIKVKYTWLKSISGNHSAPTVYLEGGDGSSTWQAKSPEDLTDWLGLLEVTDLIFVDRRGIDDESLMYVWTGAFPKDFFVTEAAANLHYGTMAKKSLKTFRERGGDVTGYTIEEYAKDVNDLMTALGMEQYSIFGFSFGSHIGMSVMKLFPERVTKAILVGADAPNQSFNYPRYLESHIERLARMIALEAELKKDIPDFTALVHKVMGKLEKNPVTINVQNPLTAENMDLKIGAFGLALILRLDIDDYTDIPVIPRLLYTIWKGDYSMFTWFVQKRIAYAIALPGNGINQQLASGVSELRWSQIKKEAQQSIFGNVVNFPFSAAKDHWVSNTLSFEPSKPLLTDIPTLFITGELDCRTPIEQVEETMMGFSEAIHVKVENAGHEQAMWAGVVVDEIIPNFLKDKKIRTLNAYYADLNFIKVWGKAKGHPSIK